MTPYAATKIELEDQELLLKIKRIMNLLPDIDLGKDERGHEKYISCHSVCRVLAERFGLECVDGIWHMGYEHSWLMTKNGNIIDPYPVGTIGGVLLMPGDYAWRKLYKQSDDLIGTKDADFEANTEILRQHLKNIDDAEVSVQNLF